MKRHKGIHIFIDTSHISDNIKINADYRFNGSMYQSVSHIIHLITCNRGQASETSHFVLFQLHGDNSHKLS